MNYRHNHSSWSYQRQDSHPQDWLRSAPTIPGIAAGQLRNLLILVAAYLLFSNCGVASAEVGTVSWKRAGDDLEIGSVKTGRLPLLSSKLSFLRTSLKQFRIGVLRAADYKKSTADVRMLCQRSKAVACINANFFDEQHKPLGLVVSQGKMLSKMHRGGSTLTGIFQLDRSGIQILNRDNASPEKMVEAVQAGPRLISDYKPISWRGGNSNATRRSGVCIDKKNRFIMYVVASGVLGISPEELQKILSSPEVACKDALNLDGGGSSQMYFSGKVRGAPVDLKSIFVEGSDHIPVALALFQTEAGKR